MRCVLCSKACASRQLFLRISIFKANFFSILCRYYPDKSSTKQGEWEKMNLTLTWTTPPFSAQKDIPLLDLEVFQEENAFAKAHLVVDVRTSLPPTGTEGTIQGNDKEIFFQGRLVGTPLHIKGDVAKIELIACPSDFK